MDEFSLSESQTLGTGFVIDANDGGSVSQITDRNTYGGDSGSSLNETDKQNSVSDPILDDTNNWGVMFTHLFNRTNITPATSSKRSLQRKEFSNEDKFEDNVNLSKLYSDVGKDNVPARPRRIVFRNQSSISSQDTPKPVTTVDFLKDHPSEMTNGRKIALALMKYKWYNPKDVSGTVSSNVDSTRAITRLASARAVSDGESPDEREENIVETTEESDEIEEDSLEKAWAYFEHVTLPRYVYDAETSNNKSLLSKISNCCAWKKYVNMEVAESGEMHFATKLYNPLFTPIRDIADFGLGIGLYLATLKSVVILMFIAGLISIPNILYFSGSDYSANQPGVIWQLKGSAICTEHEWVPCLDCGRDNLEGDRVISEMDQNGEFFSFAKRNTCDGAIARTVWTNYAATLVFILGLVIISYRLSKKEERFDDDQQTAQDYSIVIRDPPTNAHDPEEWKDFFQSKFDGAHVSCCTVVVENDELVKTLVERRELLLTIRRELPQGVSLDPENPEKLATYADEYKKEKKCRIFNGIPEHYEKLIKLEDTIKKLSGKDYPVISVFITFENERTQRRVLSLMNKATNPGPKYYFNGDRLLRVEEPAEPSSIRWKDLSENRYTILTKLIIPFLVTVALTIASALIVRLLRNGWNTYPGKPMYAAIAISVGNFIFPMIAKALTDLEIHYKEGGVQTSMYIKLALFRWVNTTIVTHLIQPHTSKIGAGEDHLLQGVYAIFLSEIVIVTSLQLVDIIQNLKRHFFAPRAKTQEDMYLYMRGNEVDLADQYTKMTKIMVLTGWYAAIYPAAFFFGAFALFVNLYTDKFSLLRTWAPMPRFDQTISRINRIYFFMAIGVSMIVLSSYSWAGFSYDNLCSFDEYFEGNFIGTYSFTVENNGSEENIMIDVTDESVMYRYCDQNLFRNFVFPALPSFQQMGLKWMTSEQENLAQIFAWTTVGVLVIACVVTAYSFGLSFGRERYKAIGKDKKIQFSASGAYAYIPQFKSDAVPYPLIACSVKQLRHSELFNWESPYHSHDYFDLTLDAEQVLKGTGDHVADNAFSSVRYWEPPFE